MMENYLHDINTYLQMHPHMGIIFAFIIALTESLPLIGTIIPGSITMTVIGILIGRGLIPGFTTLIWATLGALAGDTIGFYIGKYYNEGLLNVWPFKKHPTWLTKGEDFFKKHGGKSILIGRFVGPARSSVPLIAGLLKMPWGRFFLAAIPSAFLWAIAYMLPGVLIGAISLELPKGMTTKFIIIGLVVIVFLWLIFWAIQRFFVFLASFFNRLINKTWDWLSHHHGSKFLIRLITNRNNPKDHHQLTLIILAGISLLLFITVLLNVIFQGSFTHLNQPLFHFLQSIRTHHADAVFVGITLLGDSPDIFVFGLIIVLGLMWKKQWRSVWHFLALLIITGACVYFLKWIIHSPRPSGLAYQIPSSSFPSGHTTFSLAFYGFAAFLIAKQISRKWHWISYSTAATLIVLIGFSRLYLGAHWFTDILGSIFLGFTILLIVITSYRRYPPKPFATVYWFIFMVLALLIPWGAYTGARYNTMIKRYEYLWPTQTIYMNAWWTNPTKYLPVYRQNRFGNPIQPFNVQWADTIDNIKQNLKRQGWTIIHNTTDMKNALNRFASYKPEQHLPLFPQLYRHQPAVLFVIKHVPKKQTIIELRLWSTGITFNNTEVPLWIGSINYHIPPHRLISLKKLHEITLAETGGIDELQKDISHYQWKKIKVSLAHQPKRITPLEWDGTIIIIRRPNLSSILSFDIAQSNHRICNRSPRRKDQRQGSHELRVALSPSDHTGPTN